MPLADKRGNGHLAYWTVVIVGLASGLMGLLLDGLAGAAIGRVTLWKGPAIVAAGAVGQISVGLLLGPIGNDEPLLLGWVLFVLFAGLAAWALGVSVRASSIIIISGVLALMLFGFAFVHVLLRLIAPE
jgi:hypothetical protein